jgi:hypothetical protein
MAAQQQFPPQSAVQVMPRKDICECLRDKNALRVAAALPVASGML